MRKFLLSWVQPPGEGNGDVASISRRGRYAQAGEAGSHSAGSREPSAATAEREGCLFWTGQYFKGETVHRPWHIGPQQEGRGEKVIDQAETRGAWPSPPAANTRGLPRAAEVLSPVTAAATGPGGSRAPGTGSPCVGFSFWLRDGLESEEIYFSNYLCISV